MYMEDVDLGDRLGRAGWLNVYVPSAEMLHDKGHATGRDPGPQPGRRITAAPTFSWPTVIRSWWQAPLRWTMRAALAVRARLAVRQLDGASWREDDEARRGDTPVQSRARSTRWYSSAGRAPGCVR